MNFNKNELNILFKNIQIPMVFFTDYLTNLDSNSVKLYLYMLYLSENENQNLNINNLSQKLGIAISQLEESLKVLENKGLILPTPDGFSIIDIQEVQLNKTYELNLSLSEKKIEEVKTDKSRQNIIKVINRDFFYGKMNSGWYNDIISWFDLYHFDDNLMLSLFNYCKMKSSLHPNYVAKIAQTWYNNNIKTFEDLEAYNIKTEKFNLIKKKIKKKLNRFNNLTEYEEAYIEKWYYTFGYDMDVIELALKRSIYKQDISFEYLNTVISDWNEHNLKTCSDILNYIETSKENTSKAKTLKETVSNLNYMQRNYDALNSFYSN